MALFASAFAKPMKIRARLFLFDKPINCSAFLFTFCFHVSFSRSYESCSNMEETQSNRTGSGKSPVLVKLVLVGKLGVGKSGLGRNIEPN